MVKILETVTETALTNSLLVVPFTEKLETVTEEEAKVRPKAASQSFHMGF